MLLDSLESLGLSASVASSTAAVLAMLIATVFSMIVGEMVPKTLAVSLPLATAKVAAGPVRWFGIAMKPDGDRRHPGDVVVRSFAAIGWGWGGDWRTLKDYMHFSLTGR